MAAAINGDVVQSRSREQNRRRADANPPPHRNSGRKKDSAAKLPAHLMMGDSEIRLFGDGLTYLTEQLVSLLHFVLFYWPLAKDAEQKKASTESSLPNTKRKRRENPVPVFSFLPILYTPWHKQPWPQPKLSRKACYALQMLLAELEAHAQYHDTYH